MSSDVVIQDFVSSCESIRIKLSQTAWKWGVGTFFSERVPFTANAGPAYAAKIVGLYADLVQTIYPLHKIDRKLHIYEFGSGMGVLAKHVLDCLRKNYPLIYEKTVLHLTDIRDEIITSESEHAFFAEHDGHVVFEIFDILSPAFSNIPVFAYSTYLYDSLPQYQIEASPDGVFDVQVSTSLSSATQILDTTVFPPKLVQAKSIIQKDHLAPKIVPHLKYAYRNVPIEDVLDAKACEDIKAYLSWLSPNGPVRFNYHPLMGKSFRALLELMPKESLYVLCDFGVPEPVSQDKLITEYGVAAFYSTNFSYLRFCAQSEKTHALITQHAQNNQELLLYRGDNILEVGQHFEKWFQGSTVDTLSDVAGKILAVMEDKENYITSVESYLGELTDDERKDYAFLTTIASKFLEYNRFDMALKYAHESLDVLGPFSVDSFLILAGINLQTGQFKQGFQYLKKSMDVAPNDARNYGLPLSVLFKQGAYKEFVGFAKNFLKYQRSNEAWPLLMLAKAYTRLREPAQANICLTAYLSIGKQSPDMVHPAQMAEAEQLLKQIELQVKSPPE